MPDRPRPIVVIGAGGIVRDAHLPAYRLAGFDVVGTFDLDVDKARALALDFDIPAVFASMELAVASASEDVVFDVAVPGGAVLEVVEALPDGAAVLIQKPLGRTLDEARTISAVCRRKGLTAAVNFQLRYAPPFLALRDLLDSGRLGVVHDIQMQVTILPPWNLWDFLQREERVEILYHSIHYFDAIRALAGDPLAKQTLIERIYRPLHAHSTDLVTTLWSYLDNGRSLEATARELFVHPNTVRYRLKRVSEVIGWDATGPREALILQTALILGSIGTESVRRRPAALHRRVSA